jgi:nucleotide-binding universal stress UspA family protein
MDILQKMSDIWLEEKAEAEKELEEAAACLAKSGSVDTRLVEGEDISEEILKIAEEIGARLIVLGNKGRSAIERFFLGSVSSKVAHHAPCSVLLAKE